jgi:hypothetical protein
MPTQPEMEIRNQRYMDLIVRELREQVLRGQQRRADGVIVIEAAVESGALSNRVSVLSKYRVKLGG